MIINDFSQWNGGNHCNRVRVKVVKQLPFCQVHPVEYLLDVQVASSVLSQYLTEKVYRLPNGLYMAFFLPFHYYCYADYPSGGRDV
jgi:hypothetical protein